MRMNFVFSALSRSPSAKRTIDRGGGARERIGMRREHNASVYITEVLRSFSENTCKHFRARLFPLINIGQCCERNNTSVKQQSAIKSGYRKCYRTSRIVFCGEQKYWIFYKRSQTLANAHNVRRSVGEREEGWGRGMES